MRPLFYHCHNTTSVEKGNSATMGGCSSTQASWATCWPWDSWRAPVWGRARRARRAPPPSVFYVLVFGLTITDLLGKCLVSLRAVRLWRQNRSLQGWCPEIGRSLCQAFAFFMSFFRARLDAAAAGNGLGAGSPGAPLLPSTAPHPAPGAMVAPVVSACLAFCAALGGLWEVCAKYCPGTWCFFQMAHEERSLSVLGYSVLYASLMLLLVLAIVLCNLGAMRNLYTMHLRLRGSCALAPGNAPSRGAEKGGGRCTWRSWITSCC